MAQRRTALLWFTATTLMAGATLDSLMTRFSWALMAFLSALVFLSICAFVWLDIALRNPSFPLENTDESESESI